MKKPKQIPDFIKHGILNESNNLPNVQDIVEHWILLCGGYKAFTEMMFQEYKSAAPGSLVRLRIVEMLTKLMERLGGITESEELGMLSNQDLEAALESKLSRVHQVVENVTGVEASQTSAAL
jgi:hypothetical protein